uniref:Uncharacterized protein n=1 Tax=Anguilla anguilla TaxID=7936 RepID=A0A0E9U9Z2_ANGAN
MSETVQKNLLDITTIYLINIVHLQTFRLLTE